MQSIDATEHGGSGTSAATETGRLSLRERKKLGNQRRMREEALRLFKEQGFDETTVEQIAEAAEVSPSTFFRYYPTKESVLFKDEFDPIVIDALRSQPKDKSPIRAVRDSLASAFSAMTPQEERQFLDIYRLAISTTAMRGHLYQNMMESIDLFATIMAEWRGVLRDEPAVRTFVGATTGAILEAATEWVRVDGARSLRVIIDEHLARLEEWLTF